MELVFSMTHPFSKPSVQLPSREKKGKSVVLAATMRMVKANGKVQY